MIVVDTNIIGDLVFPTRDSAVAHALHERNPAWELPALWRSQFLDIIGGYHRRHLIDMDGALRALELAERLAGPRQHLVHPRAIIETMTETGCSSYESEFVVLAKQLGTNLITHNRKVIGTFPGLALTPEEYLNG